MDSLKDLLQHKAKRLDEASSSGELDAIEKIIKDVFGLSVRARSLNDSGTLLLTSSSSSIISELRLRQVQLKQRLNDTLELNIHRIRTKIE